MEKKKTIMMLCIALLVMTVGYAALSRVININGTAEITSTWNLQFTSISATGQTDGATEINTPNASGTTATFHVGLKAPGDEITYLITLSNLGSINAVISEITASELGNNAIKFEVSDIAKGDKIAGQAQKVFKVKISFDSSVTEQPSLNDNKIELTIKCVQDLSQTITPGELEISKTRLSAKILSDNIPRSDADIDFSKTSEEDGTSGLYYTSTNTENNRTTYYFRGAVDNNYVKFGGGEDIYACQYNGKDVVEASTYGDTIVFFQGTSENNCTTQTVCEFPDVFAEEFGSKYVIGLSEEECVGEGTWTGQTPEYAPTPGIYTCKIKLSYGSMSVNPIAAYTKDFMAINLFPTEEQCLNNAVCYIDDMNIGVLGVDRDTCITGGGAWWNDEDVTSIGATLTKTYEYKERDEIYWRIVRINEDGSIRLIYQGATADAFSARSVIGNGGFNEELNDNAYVGYMYGTPGSDNYADTHANENDSTIKGVLDDWYVANLSNYESYLADPGFCNDRSVAAQAGLWSNINGVDTALGYGNATTYYRSYNRLVNTYKPQFKCPNTSSDLFTLYTNTKGNEALTYPIGLITADEVAYAGGVNEKENGTFYLNSGWNYWTMTSNYFDGSRAGVWRVGEISLHYNPVTYSADVSGIRPVINLRADVEIISGDGKVGTEYVIKTN